MQAGELREKITIERYEKRKNERGGTEGDFLPYKTIWAKVNNLYGSEYWSAKAYHGENTVEFTVRFDAAPDLTKRDRILFRGRYYNIRHIDNINFKNQWLKIRGEEKEL